MYFEDLSLYSYREQEKMDNLYNIGWLEKNHEFSKGQVPDEFVDKLWDYSHFAVANTRGFHICDLCDHLPNEMPSIEYKSNLLKVGTAEIRVFGKNNKIYAAPNLVFHYVTKHGYKPADEFIEAVMEKLDPYSKTYQDLLTKTFKNWKLLENS